MSQSVDSLGWLHSPNQSTYNVTDEVILALSSTLSSRCLFDISENQWFRDVPNQTVIGSHQAESSKESSRQLSTDSVLGATINELNNKRSKDCADAVTITSFVGDSQSSTQNGLRGVHLCVPTLLTLAERQKLGGIVNRSRVSNGEGEQFDLRSMHR